MTGTDRRPLGVTLAVAALGAALLLGLAILLLGWRVPWIAAATLVIVGSLIVSVALRQNWARWALLVVTILALVTTYPLVRFQLTYGALVPAATVAQLVLEMIGFVLLFRPGAARWYRGGPAA